MATNQTQNYEIPPEMRDFAEKSVEQARKAIDGFMSAAQKTADTFEGSATTVQASAKDAARKTFSYTEQNLSAAFDLAQRMVRAKDMQEAMQIQAEFVRDPVRVDADPDEGIRLHGSVGHEAAGHQEVSLFSLKTCEDVTMAEVKKPRAKSTAKSVHEGRSRRDGGRVGSRDCGG